MKRKRKLRNAAVVMAILATGACNGFGESIAECHQNPLSHIIQAKRGKGHKWNKRKGERQ